MLTSISSLKHVSWALKLHTGPWGPLEIMGAADLELSASCGLCFCNSGENQKTEGGKTGHGGMAER